MASLVVNEPVSVPPSLNVTPEKQTARRALPLRVSLEECCPPLSAGTTSSGVLAILTAKPPLFEEWRVIEVYETPDLSAKSRHALRPWQLSRVFSLYCFSSTRISSTSSNLFPG